MTSFTIHHGDCLNVLKTMPDNSVDSIVTDPPYGIKFMGKAWDYEVPSVEKWVECLRVLKPGGHLLAFAGTRTQHRMAINIEDAGFELRDMLAWLYGSGFPKSKNLEDEWEGWGTNLKPAMEPITMARKPLEGTTAANTKEYGTGALNIDGCRVPIDDMDVKGRWPANVLHDGSPEVLEHFPITKSGAGNFSNFSGADKKGNTGAAYGRESRPAGTEMIAYGDQGSTARFFYCAKASTKERHAGLEEVSAQFKHGSTLRDAEKLKAHKGNNHPTVKPVALMRYLIRLVTKPGGTVLDPFCGSGSTGVAAIKEGMVFIGVEQAAHDVNIANARCLHAYSSQPDLFSGVS